MKRFYKDVAVGEIDGGWQVMLDGRGIKTPLGNQQVVPTQALAEILANEWRDQGDEIDPSLFLFRDHADYAIDIVAQEQAETISKLLGYAETDTLCYRADPEEPLFARQQEVWEPLIEHLEGKFAVRFQRVSGVMHKPQPAETLDRLREHLESLDHFALAGLTAMTSLAASLITALLANDEMIDDPLLLWRDANLEEEWQAEQWGRDAQAEARRKKRTDDFSTAQVFVALARPHR